MTDEAGRGAGGGGGRGARGEGRSATPRGKRWIQGWGARAAAGGSRSARAEGGDRGVGSRPRARVRRRGDPPPRGGRTAGASVFASFVRGGASRRSRARAGWGRTGAVPARERGGGVGPQTHHGRRLARELTKSHGGVRARERLARSWFCEGRARGRIKPRARRPFSRRSGESDASRERHPADRRGDLAISRAGLIGSPGRSRVKRRSRAGARSKDTVGRIDGRSTIDRPVGQIAPPPSAAARCIVLRASAVRRSGVAFASPPSRTRRSRARGILP